MAVLCYTKRQYSDRTSIRNRRPVCIRFCSCTNSVPVLFPEFGGGNKWRGAIKSSSNYFRSILDRSSECDRLMDYSGCSSKRYEWSESTYVYSYRINRNYGAATDVESTLY